MTQRQSVISAIVTFLLIFVAPYLAKYGFELTEANATTIVTGLVALCAWAWSSWKNHNYTQEGYEGTLVTREYKSLKNEEVEEVEEGEE